MIRRQGPFPLYYEASPTNRPTLSVEPGEPFEVITQMNRGPNISAVPPDLRDEWSKHHSYEVERANPSSGAIWVYGAKPGMVMEVVIEDMELAPVGYAMFAGNNLLFPSTPVTAANLGAARVVRIRGDQVIWDRGLTIPARPMVGMVAVAPAHEAQSTARVGHWGGNMDVQEVGPGATVRLVVNVRGALLHIGDVHALQGDGEIGGTGVETSALLRLRVELTQRPEGMTWPRIVTPRSNPRGGGRPTRGKRLQVGRQRTDPLAPCRLRARTPRSRPATEPDPRSARHPGCEPDDHLRRRCQAGTAPGTPLSPRTQPSCRRHAVGWGTAASRARCSIRDSPRRTRDRVR